MSAAGIAFLAGLANFLYGCFKPQPACLLIAALVAIALWRAHRLDMRARP